MTERAVTQREFGTLPDGRGVAAVTLTNASGMAATVIAWGATLQALTLPGANGPVDVVLGFATLDAYLAQTAYFGATVGRFANRIARGRFILDGVEYQLAVNDGANALHGGTAGFDRQLWDIVATGDGAVKLRHVSPAGEEGYPGTLTVDATYTLGDDDTLTLAYSATTDAPTIVNLTNHSYWNLAGEGSPDGAMGHVVTIAAEHYLPTDAGSIPTGEVRSVAGTAFDYRAGRPVSDWVRDATEPQLVIGRGYDHDWVFGDEGTMRVMATATDPVSGRSLEISSDAPGLQFYSGNFLDGTLVGKAAAIYRAGDALVFEPQRHPDTPNQPALGSARLAPGEVYRHTIIYRLTR